MQPDEKKQEVTQYRYTYTQNPFPGILRSTVWRHLFIR